MATDLVINIASQFLGKKAFLDADKATKKLTGSVKTLGRTLGVTLSAAAVLAYGKASVKAASEDIKAQKLLANSLKNVGLAYATVDVEGFISKMQSQTGVLDDQLRPAFAKLAGVTGSVAKTEKLMALAFDVSSGSSLDYASAVDLLSQAYVGNTKGLKQLNLGVTQAEIKAMSFDEVMALLNERFAGSGKAAIDTYAGQMSLLAVASSNASEIIGTSLLGAIDSLTGSDGIANVGTDIENAAKSLSNFIDSVVYLKEQIASIPGAGIVKGAIGLVGNVLGRFSPQRAAELLKEIKGPQPFSQPMTLANQDTGRANLAAQKAAESAAIKRNKELAALAKSQAKSAAATLKAKQEQAKLDKAIAAGELALNKGVDIFDMEKIQLNAALIGQAEALGKATSGAQLLAIVNDVARLKVKQDMLALEDAIASKDTAAIERATKKLNEDLKILGTLQNQSIKLTDIKSLLDSIVPKDLIDQQNLDDALEKIKKMMLLLAGGLGTINIIGGPGGGTNFGIKDVPKIEKLTGKESIGAILEYSDAVTTLANVMADTLDAENYQNYLSLIEYQKKLGDFGGYSTSMGSGAGSSSYGYNPVVTVEVIDKTSGLIEVVQNAVQENNRFGNNLNFAGAL
ncbi:MAG: hypothetical protein EBU05_08080 [Chitinophagia bacterium]|nr:hypothetical protein [Chitinophagia bacterium]